MSESLKNPLYYMSLKNMFDFAFYREKAPNRYGFVEKVVDGMFVQINSVIISFKFQAFLATFQMSRLRIQSATPKWQPDDLRMTRVKDETRGEVLTFKEITWQTLRIDANALYDVRNLYILSTCTAVLRKVIQNSFQQCSKVVCEIILRNTLNLQCLNFKIRNRRI